MKSVDVINNINNKKIMSDNKQVTIINDAAWVGYELANGLRELNVDVRYLPRNFAGPNVKN